MWLTFHDVVDLGSQSLGKGLLDMWVECRTHGHPRMWLPRSCYSHEEKCKGMGCMLIRHFLALVHYYLFLHGRLKSGFLSLVYPS